MMLKCIGKLAYCIELPNILTLNSDNIFHMCLS